MSIAAGKSGSFSVEAGEHIFLEGQDANTINILAKGKVNVYISPSVEQGHMDGDQLLAESYRLFSIDQNIFIGANDLFLSKKHTLSYRASKDTVIFSYLADSMNEVEELFRQKNDYPAYVLNSISNMIDCAYASLKKLEQLIKSLSVTTDNLCLLFWILKDKHGFTYEPLHSAFRDSMSKLQELKERKISLPYSFDEAFLECSHFEYDYFPSEEIDTLKMNYYKHICSLDESLKRQFLNQNFVISQYSCTDCSLLLENILVRIKEAFKVAEEYMEMFYSAEETCIFEAFLKAGAQLEDSRYEPTDIIEVLQYMSDKIKNMVDVFKNDYHHTLGIDTDAIEENVSHLMVELALKRIDASESFDLHTVREGIPEELNNSAEKILAYSNIPKDRYDFFMNALGAFRQLKDKQSGNELSVSISKDLTSVFFEIYEAVLKRVAAENNQDKLLHLFLTYAYMDEKLLSPEHLWSLYEIGNNAASSDQCYSMKNWLQLIYNKEKNPSVNSFAMDYFDVFREMRKHGEVREKDKAEYENNRDGRLNFEISNLFKPNQRLCSRHSGNYFPILYDEIIIKDLDKALVTPQKVNEAIQKVLEVDFSAFHREISYFNQKKGIEKEFIMQSVRPDIILMPAYGTTSLMWQDIAGRVRNSPGRFIIPIFTAENLNDMIQRLIGEFRWELSKTMLGLVWNDITIKSLTSEYMDYLQFFKKNRDISEESKEKLKKQIKRYRNISKDIFTSDYVVWLNYESNGTIRLNKLVRDILYKYCPFSKDIRGKLSNHPSFTAPANQFEKLRTKQVKDLENRHARYTRNGIALDEEMIETLNFYKNL